MKWLRESILVFAACAGLSCGGNTAPPSTAGENSPAELAGHDGKPPAAGQHAPKRVQMNIPEGAKWTVFCATFSGPGHAANAKSMKDYLLQGTTLRDWYIVQSEQSTTLYHGFYREVDERANAAEGKRAQSDRHTIASLTDPRNGDRLFRSVLLMPLDDADPTAPGEWDLRSAKGFWSLQIAAFRDDPHRKENAVAVVRDLRSHGYEAYFFHGPTTSSVCIGAFPMEAIKKQEMSVASTNDPNAVLLVAPGSVPLPDGGMVTPEGKRIVAVQSKVEVLDPKLMAMMRSEEFGFHADNGQIGKIITDRSGRKLEVKKPSFLVLIPHEETAPVATVTPGTPPSPDSTPPIRPADVPRTVRITPNPSVPQGGKLKSLDN